MAKRKSSKKITKKSSKKLVQHRTISFLVGIVTVTLIALAIFGIAQGKNYKSVLGTESPTLQQNSK